MDYLQHNSSCLDALGSQWVFAIRLPIVASAATTASPGIDPISTAGINSVRGLRSCLHTPPTADAWCDCRRSLASPCRMTVEVKSTGNPISSVHARELWRTQVRSDHSSKTDDPSQTPSQAHRNVLRRKLEVYPKCTWAVGLASIRNEKNVISYFLYKINWWAVKDSNLRPMD